MFVIFRYVLHLHIFLCSTNAVSVKIKEVHHLYSDDGYIPVNGKLNC